MCLIKKVSQRHIIIRLSEAESNFESKKKKNEQEKWLQGIPIRLLEDF